MRVVANIGFAEFEWEEKAMHIHETVRGVATPYSILGMSAYTNQNSINYGIMHIMHIHDIVSLQVCERTADHVDWTNYERTAGLIITQCESEVFVGRDPRHRVRRPMPQHLAPTAVDLQPRKVIDDIIRLILAQRKQNGALVSSDFDRALRYM